MLRSPRFAALFASVALLPASLAPQGYKLPPREVVEIVDAPATPAVDLSPDARWMLLLERPSMPSIADVTRPWLPLAGIRVDPRLNNEQVTSFITGIVLRSVKSGEEKRVTLPAGARVVAVSWSHTSQRFAFTIASDTNGLELWTATTPDPKPIMRAPHLDGVLGEPFTWMPDGDSVLAKIIDAERGDPPARADVPEGPVMQETRGTKTPLRTYQDLLTDAVSERELEYYATSRLFRIDLARGGATAILPPSLLVSATPSPDGQHILVTRLAKPFSYVLPWNLFPQTIDVVRADGKPGRTIATLPMGENIPMEGVRLGPRNVHWQSSAPATLAWCEALDGGDPKSKADFRDRWMALDAPFAGDGREMFRLAQRARGLTWMRSPREVLASEYDRDRRWTRTLLFDLEHPASAPRVVDDRSQNDRYADPGNFQTTLNDWGMRIVRQDGPLVYRAGQGASPEGERPFLDRLDLTTMKSDRLWQCASGKYETVIAFAQSGANILPSVITSYESPTEPPNYELHDLQAKTDKALTSFPDPQPQMRGVHQELVKYKRADGVDLSATLYLPKAHTSGTRLPLVVWAYPLEFSDAGTAGQVSSSPWRFVRVRGPSHLLFLTQGYAVLDGATMPVIGDPEKMNDTFLEQVVSSAKAAIDKAVEMGVADRERAGVGGHSYGAFMTANLLAHSDLFKAGIARSGAYNRTLTPFGFQTERRTLWEAPDAYIKLSPFMNAQKIHAPILFIHGGKDSNQGTFPIQSERMYQAVKGNGGTARLVILPGEAHGYAARESVLHTLAEMIEWFDRYVKKVGE